MQTFDDPTLTYDDVLFSYEGIGMASPNIVSFGILSLDIATGAVGITVTVSNTGTGFWGTMAVTVGGISATVVTLIDHQHLSFVVPVGAITGTVVVTNPDLETGNAGTFTVAGVGGGEQFFFFDGSMKG